MMTDMSSIKRFANKQIDYSILPVFKSSTLICKTKRPMSPHSTTIYNSSTLQDQRDQWSMQRSLVTTVKLSDLISQPAAQMCPTSSVLRNIIKPNKNPPTKFSHLYFIKCFIFHNLISSTKAFLQQTNKICLFTKIYNVFLIICPPLSRQKDDKI